ncbi:MAG: hypothetical protein ACLFPX_05825 [Candidatus Omnitrophota bacterium]
MKRHKGIFAVALFCLCVGGAWSSTVAYRIYEARPKPVIRRVQPPSRPSTIKTMTRTLRRVKPSLIQSHHVILLWVLISVEVICAVFYVIAGLLLLKPYRLGPPAVMGVMTLDLLFKAGAITYMKWYAIPLSHILRSKKNILALYYAPGEGPFALLSQYFTGLAVYRGWAGWIFLVFYVSIVMGCICYLWRSRKLP